MYEVKEAASGAILGIVPELSYIRFNKVNKMAVGTTKENAQGITLDDGKEVYAFESCESAPENYTKITIQEKTTDAIIFEMQEKIAKQDEANAEILLAQAEMAIMQGEQDDVLSAILLSVI